MSLLKDRFRVTMETTWTGLGNGPDAGVMEKEESKDVY
jgi:hypothetical protein